MQISNPNSVNNSVVSRISVTTPPQESGCKLVPPAPKEPGALTDRLKMQELDLSSALSTVSFYANPQNEIETALKPSTQGDRLANFQSHLKYFDTDGLQEMKSAIQERMAQPKTASEDLKMLKQMYTLTDEALSARPPQPPRKPDSGRDWRLDFCA